LRVIAEAIDVPVEDLRTLNAHVLRWTTPPDDPDFQLILPKGYADKFNEQIASLPDNKRILVREHVVRKGETLGSIAKRYGTSVAQVSQANHLGKTPVLKVGQSLVIPISEVTAPSRLTASKTSVPATRTTATVSRTRPVGPTRTSYTVRRGDTLAKIAARFNTTIEQLKLWIHLASTKLGVGKKLLVSGIPTQTASESRKKVIHQVKQGETLDRIATTYNTSVDAILSWKETEDLSVLHPGDRITIFLGGEN